MNRIMYNTFGYFPSMKLLHDLNYKTIILHVLCHFHSSKSKTYTATAPNAKMKPQGKCYFTTFINEK